VSDGTRPTGGRPANAGRPRLPLSPRHPERTCWGCTLYCPADQLACGNGTIRTQHPVELFGEDWLDWCEGRARRRGAGAAPSSGRRP
jgi:hypothetical protein